jgi:quercetin dioxygenase-like cupin family protein
MHIKKAYIKKGTGGHFEELVRELLPRNNNCTEIYHDMSHPEHSSHTHSTDEMLHVWEGTVYFYTAGREVTLYKEGDCVVLPKNAAYSLKPGPDGCTTYVISIIKKTRRLASL